MTQRTDKGKWYQPGRDGWGDTRSDLARDEHEAIKKVEEEAKKRNQKKHGGLYEDRYQ